MNTVSIEFRTDGSVANGGFRIRFTSNDVNQCGGTIGLAPSFSSTSVNSGVITTPGNGSTYNNSMWCVWRFQSPAGSSGTLLFQFTQLQLEFHHQCFFDSVEIFEGYNLDSDALSLGRHCNHSQSTLEIPAALGPNSVFIVFKSDFSVGGLGFNLTYTFYNCGGRVSLPSNNWLSIKNPGHPNFDRTKQRCIWLAEGDPDSRAQFRFDNLNINCNGGNVTVYNGDSLLSPRVIRLCSSGSAPTLGQVVPVETNRMRILYKLDSNSRGKFQLSTKAPLGQCGGVIHSLTGNLSTPNYPSRFTGGTACTWVIAAPTGYHLRLNFSSHFDLPPTSGRCSENYVTAVEFEPSEYAERMLPIAMRNHNLLPSLNTLLPQYCSITSAPSSINSTQNGVAIVFQGLTSASGFQLSWGIGCGGTFVDDTGIISSPDYPNNYRNNLRCDYVVKPGSNGNGTGNGRFIIFDFLSMNVEYGSRCQHDYLEILEGNQTFEGQSLAKYCGSALPQSLAVSKTSAIVRFVSDSSLNGTGFQLRYRATSCGGLMTGSSGVFGTPTTPQDYPHGADCEWRIRAPIGRIVVLDFTQFGIEAHSRCAFDYVEVFDGDNDQGESLGRFCGSVAPEQLRSTQRSLFIKFHSDHSISSIGFVARYRLSHYCGGQYNVSENGAEQTISSFDADNNGNYEPDLDCLWKLQVVNAATTNKIIQMTFDTFQLQPPLANGTCVDCLQIGDASFVTDSDEHTCGNSLRQRTFTSTGPYLTLRFKSNGESNYPGFRARFKAIPSLCLCLLFNLFLIFF